MATVKEKFIRFLRWSEKYTKTDMVYFFKGNFWLNLNRAASVLNGLVLSTAFARLLTKEEYGTYAFALALLGVFSMPQTTALGAGIIKGVARGNHRLIFEGLKKVFPWSIVGAIALGATAAYYYYMGNLVLAGCFILGAVVLPVSVKNSIAKSFFTSKGDFEFLARFNLWRTPAMTLALVLAAAFSHSALIVVWANTLGNVFLGSLMYRQMKKKYDLTLTGESEERFATKYAFHSGVLSIFGYLSEQLDDILLWKFAGAAPVAIYTYATTPVRELRALIENQSALALPKFARKELSEIHATLGFRIKQMYFIAVPLIILYVLLAPFIFSVLFPQYTNAVALSQIASLSLLSAPRRLLSAAITAHQRIKESYVMIVLPNLIRIVLACVFIPLWGISGAVIALLVSEVIDFAVLGILMRHAASPKRKK